MKLTITRSFIFLTLLISYATQIQAQNCTGDINLATQTDVDSFQVNYGCSVVEGNLIIQTNGTPAIVNLNGLSGLVSVSGDLQITVNPSLSDINGLNNMQSIGQSLIVGFNPLLTNVNACNNINSIGHNLIIALNQSLANLDGFSGVQDIYGSLGVTANTALENIDGLNNVQYVGQDLNISQNSAINHLDGLSNITLVGQLLEISFNSELHNIDGLNNIASIGSNLNVTDNPLLSECCILDGLINNPGVVAGTINLANNQTGCASPAEVTSCPVDMDGDGFDDTVDCDDTDPNTYPGAAEICDGKDNNCDGVMPDDEIDTDGDGVTPCAGDFDESDINSYAGAPEICDGLDNDGDGNIPADEIDNDGDGFTSCNGDFDDSDATSYPNAPEVCDGFDNDGDGQIPAEELDNDGDGMSICEGDCDDNNPAIYPGAEEICDGLDNNCDGSIDENISCSSYSESYAMSTEYEWIKKVKMGSINNHSNNDNGYGDYTDLSTAVMPGNIYSIRLKPGFASYPYWEWWRVWIDWNQDGDFNDPGEKEVQTISYKNVKRYFRVPVNAVPGETRMRVSMKYGGFASPDQVFEEGEVEDYTITVIPPGSNMNVQGDVFTFSSSKNNMATQLDWRVSDDVDVDYYEVQTSVDGENFEVIETVTARQSEQATEYNSIDTEPEIGNNFYRIKMVDIEGEVVYSDIREETFDININEVIVYPNPTDGMLFLSMRDFIGQGAKVEIYNAAGQKMDSKTVAMIQDAPVNFDVSSYPSGNYTLNVKVDDLKQITKQFVVVKR